MFNVIVIIALSTLSTVLADVRHILVDEAEYSPPPRPYAFGYAAGRYPGHIDRTHSEVSDGAGIVQGSYSYVDPNFKIRKVDYVADKEGFHPVFNKDSPDLPNDTPVVAAAKERHLVQYARIASAHQASLGGVVVPQDSVAVQNAKLKHLSLFEKIAAEHARIAAQQEQERLSEEARNQNSLENHY